MSIVAPNGQVRLLANVPLDSNFENTLYFESELAQRTYFLGLTPVHTMSNATRIRDGVIAVDAGEDSILNCNYLMFQNQNFSTKWFYAFITGRQYVNNGTTYISYQIDDIQTYLISGNVTLLQCLIERQHSTTDVIGDNIVGENMGSSELVTSTVLDTEDLCTYSILGTSYPKIIALNVSSFDNPAEGSEHQEDFDVGWVSAPIGQTDGIANGSLTYAFSYDDSTSMQRSLTNMIEALTKNQQSDSIIGGYVLPARMFSPFNASCHVSYRPVSAQGFDINFNDNGDADPQDYYFSTGNAFTSLDTYVPKNKKMFTAPFNWIYLTSSDGQNMVLQPQFMSDRTTVTLKNYHCITGVPEARFVLQGYKGQQECPEYFINYSDFPQLSYAIDGYKAWLASGGERRLDLSVSQTTRSQELMQNQITTMRDLGRMRAGMDIGMGALRMAYGNPLKGDLDKGAGQAINGVMSAAENEVNAQYNLEKSKQTIQFANEDADLARAIAKTLPSVNHGSASNTSLLGANNIYIRAEQRCVNRNIAKTIDDYFTMYGYAQNIVATPNIHARPKFTYVKTIGCKVNGGAPDESITRIQNIFDNGIRFWVNASEVGNYSVNNTPA